MNPKDLFSGNAPEYAAFRPDYPIELYDFIFSHVSDFSTAWDCGTGNGQSAKVLSGKFGSVHATDISDKQMANGYKSPNIFYSVSSAEHTSFQPAMFGLITVAQAAHWFNLDKFYDEVVRVAKPKCVLAVWGYGLLSINAAFDERLQYFYKNIIGPYWDIERRLLDEEYKTISFPFKEIPVPVFHFSKQWDIAHLHGYLNTWSAVQKFIKVNAFNPVDGFLENAQSLLGKGLMEIHFPLFFRVGYVNR